jgi:hypothetical protein
MPTSINRAKSVAHGGKTWSLRPQVTGAAALLIAAGAMTVCAAMLHPDFVLPVLTTLFFILAAMVALIATNEDPTAEETGLTHYDVAGFLTFIGICASSQIDPDQLVRLIEGAKREP